MTWFTDVPAHRRSAALGMVAFGTLILAYRPQQAMNWTVGGAFQSGVTTAFVSNIACCLRSIMSSQIMRDHMGYTSTYLYAELSLWALVLLVPYAAVSGLSPLTPNQWDDVASRWGSQWVVTAAGATHYFYYVASYIVLKHLSVLEHSVLNVAKRATNVLAGLLILGETATALRYHLVVRTNSAHGTSVCQEALIGYLVSVDYSSCLSSHL